MNLLTGIRSQLPSSTASPNRTKDWSSQKTSHQNRIFPRNSINYRFRMLLLKRPLPRNNMLLKKRISSRNRTSYQNKILVKDRKLSRNKTLSRNRMLSSKTKLLRNRMLVKNRMLSRNKASSVEKSLINLRNQPLSDKVNPRNNRKSQSTMKKCHKKMISFLRTKKR